MNSIVELSSQLIRLNTEKGNFEAQHTALALIKEKLQDYTCQTFQSESLQSMLFYSSRYVSRPERFSVILNAHIDVVPAKLEQFTPVAREGKLFGRGTYDMKGAAAVEILLFQELANTVSYPLGLQIVTDEEVGGFQGTKYQIDQGVKADFVIVGEPTNLAIGHKAKGILWLKITFRGESAHGAYLWQGKNSIWEMERFLEKLQSIYPVPRSEVWETTVNVASVVTENAAYNKVPDSCVLKLDVRFIPEEKELVLNRIRELLNEVAEMEVILHESSQFTALTNSYLVQLQSACKETVGNAGDVVARHGGSDLRFFESSGGRGVEFGPVGFGHHTDNEYVEVDSLDRYYTILKKFLTSF